MKVDFDTVIDRRNTNSIKYDFSAEYGMGADVLPLWVADMDFQAPPAVLAGLQRAVAHGIFGYTEVKEDYDTPFIDWYAKRFGYCFTAGDIVKAPGVVFALHQIVRAFTEPGDAVIVQTPVYYPFYHVIENNGRKLVKNPLVYENGAYTIDFVDFEQKIRTHNVKLFILCSPHNPVSRVWTREELETLNAICQRHDVLVAADEIHCDFVYPGHRHTCFGLLNGDAIVATAPSKTFNLAGLQASQIIIKNPELRVRLTDELRKTGYGQLNTLGLVACRSAYLHGESWLEQLKEYLEENTRVTRAFLAEHLPKVRLVEPQGTYLLWLDFTAYGLSQAELDRRITQGARLWLDSGTMFGPEGVGFQRINIACPRSTLTTALDRLAREFCQREEPS